MSGTLGFVTAITSSRSNEAELREMCDAIGHRGHTEGCTVPRESEMAVAEVWRLIQDRVCRNLESDVPLEPFISGGLDALRVVAAGPRERLRPVRTFSISFEDPSFSEPPQPVAVARALGYTELIVPPSAEALVHDGDNAGFRATRNSRSTAANECCRQQLEIPLVSSRGTCHSPVAAETACSILDARDPARGI